MDIQILSRESLSAHHREKARASFLAGKSKDDHNLPMGSNALVAWRNEYDRLALAAFRLNNSELMRGPRVDSTQGA